VASPAPRELLIVAGAMLAGVALLLAFGRVLWTRPFWMDEVAMFFLTSESSPGSMIGLIARGADWNPPTLHLLVWSAMRLAGLDAVTPAFLRSFALVCVLLALFFVYLALRRRCGRAASAAGVVAVAAQSLVLDHAFEGRFYAPWLLFAALFAWSLGIDAAAERSRRRDLTIAIVAILVTTIHWYGVFSLGLMCAGALWAWRSRWGEGLRLVAPAAAGVAALLALAPMALSQRASAAPVLWVHPLSAAQMEQMTRQFVPSVFVVGLALLLIADALRSRRGAAPRAPDRDPGVAALLALAAMPLVLVVLSAVLTPSMVFRYAIVATLAWAPMAALCAERFGDWTRTALLAALGLVVMLNAAAHVREQRMFDRAVAVNATAFEQAKAAKAPVVFQRLHVIYPVAGTQRGPGTPARYIDISDSTLDAMYPQPDAEAVRASFRLDRDQARYHAGLYGWPVMAPVAELDTMPRFYLVATDATLPPGYSPVKRYGAVLFPRHRVTRVGPALALFERDSAGPSVAAPRPARAAAR
jgi:hypothetical protein